MIQTAPTRLDRSRDCLLGILRGIADLRDSPALTEILELLAERRRLDLSDLTPRQQAQLIATRTNDVLPSVARLATAIEETGTAGRSLVVKFGIDPTAADVHLGHAVPMILASRLQRMGHHVIFIVGDITAMIGDPSGQSADRPRLTAEDIQRNLASYRAQVSPFFDFSRADFRFNSEWLAPITLPELLGVLEKLPVSASLQREDFRTRLAGGASLTMAEFLYSVVMALDSVKIECDVEIGGIDQLLNMQMCRRVMENAGQQAEVVITAPLIEGTDGTGAKMSKSKGNYVGLAFDATDIFGKLMSIPDRLIVPYLRALTELLDGEIADMDDRMEAGTLHPMGVKALLACDVVSTIHGLPAAQASRHAFTSQFSQRRLSNLTNLATITLTAHGKASLAEILVRQTGFSPSLGQVRRVAKQGGLRLVQETAGKEPTITVLSEDEAVAPLNSVLHTRDALPSAADQTRVFIRLGRQVAELRADG
jgi:tyrosyl-tRNA synthetase